MARLVAALAVLLTPTVSQETARQLSNSTHRAVRVFLSAQPHRCMHVMGSPRLWEHVQSWHCPEDAHLGTNFWLPRENAGLIGLVSSPGLCLDSPHGSLLQLWHCSDSAKRNNMLFQPEPAPPWLTLQGFDLPRSSDAEVKVVESPLHAQQYAEQRSYTAFSIIEGTAHFKRAHNVTREDLQVSEGVTFHLYRRDVFTLRLARNMLKCVGVRIDAKRGNLFHMMDCDTGIPNVSYTFGAEPITESRAQTRFACEGGSWEQWTESQKSWCCMVERLHCPSTTLKAQEWPEVAPRPAHVATGPSWLWLILGACAAAVLCCAAAAAAYWIPKLNARRKRGWLLPQAQPKASTQMVWRLGRIVDPFQPGATAYDMELANGGAVLSITNGGG